MKNFCFYIVAFFLSLPPAAANVEIRTVKTDNSSSSKIASLENVSEKTKRLTIKKETIGDDVKYVDVIADFARADKGDEGYWINGRGVYGNFDAENGVYSVPRSVMPIFGMKTKSKTFWAHAKTFRFDYDFRVEVRNGRYAVFLRYKIADVRKWFGDLYDDIILDFNMLEAGEDNYSAMARGYQKYQIERGAVKPIKERIKDFPELDYLCDSMIVRIQTHAAKPIPDKPIVYTKENEQEVVVHFPFGVAEEFVQAIKDSGVDKCTIVSAGWNDGGYDGRTPSHLPVLEAAGGKEAFERLVAKTQNAGYQFTLHATNTDAYKVSPMWSEDFISKNRDGSLVKGGVWAGGRCFLVCQKASYEGWVKDELVEMRKLGAKGPHYIDVYSATYPNRCADPKHLATPETMAHYQNKILELSKKIFGGAASEGGFDHVAGNIDYINYVGRDIKTLREGKHNPLVKGVYPLWELVYHGIILYNSDRATQNHTRGKCMYKIEKSGDPRWMEGDGIVDPYISLKIIEFGGRPIFYTYKFADVPRIKKTYDEFLPVRRLQRELMLSHNEIAENVFEVAYSDGTRIVANYRDREYSHNGRKIAALGYILIEPKK